MPSKAHRISTVSSKTVSEDMFVVDVGRQNVKVGHKIRDIWSWSWSPLQQPLQMLANLPRC